MELIAADIGGTKSWLAWVRKTPETGSEVLFERVYASIAFLTADDLVRQFIADAGQAARPDCLLLALPGPLHAQHTRLTNLDWTLDVADMRASLDIPHVEFINDFQAAAAGVETLTDADLVVLNAQPVEAGGVRAITGAGTGLGLAFMVAGPDGRYRTYPTEGGHIDFAPADEVQAALLERLHAKHGHVSWERVVSGTALGEIYDFCCVERGRPPAGAEVDGAALLAMAQAGNVRAIRALELFVDLYGAWVGNVALLYQPKGGLYVAGGVAVHLRDYLQSARFMGAALAKGRMRGVVAQTPIFLVTCARLGLQGAIASAC